MLWCHKVWATNYHLLTFAQPDGGVPVPGRGQAGHVLQHRGGRLRRLAPLRPRLAARPRPHRAHPRA